MQKTLLGCLPWLQTSNSYEVAKAESAPMLTENERPREENNFMPTWALRERRGVRFTTSTSDSQFATSSRSSAQDNDGQQSEPLAPPRTPHFVKLERQKSYGPPPFDIRIHGDHVVLSMSYQPQAEAKFQLLLDLLHSGGVLSEPQRAQLAVDGSYSDQRKRPLRDRLQSLIAVLRSENGPDGAEKMELVNKTVQQGLRICGMQTTIDLIERDASLVDLLHAMPTGLDWSVTHEAAACNDAARLRILLVRGHSPVARTRHGLTPLMVALRVRAKAAIAAFCEQYGCKKQFTTVLQDSRALTCFKFDGKSLVHVAAKFGDARAIDMLVEQEPSKIKSVARVYDKNGFLPIHVATKHGHYNILEQLLRHQIGGEITLKTKKGQTVFQLAVKFVRPEIARYLCQRYHCSWLGTMLVDELKMKLGVTNSDGYNLLHVSAQKGDINALKFLFDQPGFEETMVNKRDATFGNAPLHWAVEKGHTLFVQRLLESTRVNINQRSKNHWEWTPLHQATAAGRQDVTFVLLEAGANIQIRDSEGKTALHLCAERGHLALVRLIVHKSEDAWREHRQKKRRSTEKSSAKAKWVFECQRGQLCTKDNWGRSAADLAHIHKHFQTAAFLKSKKCRCDTCRKRIDETKKDDEATSSDEEGHLAAPITPEKTTAQRSDDFPSIDDADVAGQQTQPMSPASPQPAAVAFGASTSGDQDDEQKLLPD